MLHEQLLSAVWGPEFRSDIDYLRAYIRYLRQKIEVDPANPKIIVRSPGVGYVLVTRREPHEPAIPMTGYRSRNNPRAKPTVRNKLALSLIITPPSHGFSRIFHVLPPLFMIFSPASG